MTDKDEDLKTKDLKEPVLNNPDLNQPELINRKSSIEYNQQQISSISEVKRHRTDDPSICKPNQVKCPYCGGCFIKIQLHPVK